MADMVCLYKLSYHGRSPFAIKYGGLKYIESFWATLKRGVYGIYHHISVEYMQNYVDEFCFRYNNRNENMFDLVLKQSVLG